MVYVFHENKIYPPKLGCALMYEIEWQFNFLLVNKVLLLLAWIM